VDKNKSNPRESEITKDARWQQSSRLIGLLALCVLMLFLTFFRGLAAMIERWLALPEYSHGFLLPIVAIFLIWQKYPEIEKVVFSGSWLGVLIVSAGICILVVGELSAIYTISQVAFVITLVGLIISLTGLSAFRLFWAGAAMLLLMIPIPNFFLEGWSSRLQLISSELGVAIMRLFGISVFLEGNVIDLGTMKLQVVEACDGLRYMFPLVALAIVAAYFFRVSAWKRWLIVAASVPTAVVVNSLRVALIGIFVEFGSLALAEGFLHEFQGAVFFFLSCALLLFEMWLLTRLGQGKHAFKDVFGFQLPVRSIDSFVPQYRPIPRPFIASIVCLGIATIFALMPPAAEATVTRKTFAEFPLSVGAWSGKSRRLDELYENTLLATDYLLMDYRKADGPGANLFIAYYQSQRAGQSAHSPKSCIPGGGWRIVEIGETPVSGVSIGKHPLRVNRAIVELGSHREVIYYWFQQRDRVISNEYMVKWYLMVDSLTRRRSDGALVRLAAPVPASGSVADAEKNLRDLLEQVAPQISHFIPG
jgi:exosortase D (VPLPA-CTERM-specific)